jgi:hypothetical protein
MTAEVTIIEKSPTGILQFFNGTKLVNTISNAHDISRFGNQIVITTSSGEKLQFGVAPITKISSTTYTAIDANQAWDEQAYEDKISDVLIDLATNVFKGGCTVSTKYNSEDLIIHADIKEITAVGDSMVLLKDIKGNISFIVKANSELERVLNKFHLRAGNKSIFFPATLITKIGATTYTAMDPEQAWDEVAYENKISDLYKELTNSIFIGCVDSAGATVSIDLPVLAFTSTSERIEDCAPAGWPNAGDVIKIIHVTPNATRKMQMWSGLTNGVAGRIVTIRNTSTDNLMILENQNSLSLAANRFKFDHRGGYFLFPGYTVTLLHDGVEWGLFSGHTKNGHDLFDDFGGPNNTGTAPTTSYFGEAGYGMASGTGALCRNENQINNSLGSIGLSTGTTAAGYSVFKMNGRSQAGVYQTGLGYSKYCVLSRFSLTTALPTVAQNYRFMVGISATSNTNGINTNGSLMWYCDAGNANWRMYAQNTALGLATDLVSTIPVTIGIMLLGVYFPNNQGDCVYFYSSDGGITYRTESMFVRVSNNYAGAPVIGIGKSAGTTNVTADLDYIAISIKGGKT